MFRPTCLLLLLASSVSAQTTNPAPAPAVLVAPTATCTTADTVAALHRLFAKRRRVGTMLTLGAVAADLTLAGVSAANENTGSSSGGGGFGIPGNSGPLIQFGFGGFAVLYGVAVAPVMGVGIQQLIAYGPKREARIVAAYEGRHQPPAKIGRQLRKHLR